MTLPDTWFISDTHFGHDNIITYCDRPFSSVAEMDEIMIQRWNERVKHDDRVVHLGDISLSQRVAKNVGERLNGNIHLIVGNHDNSIQLHKDGVISRARLWLPMQELGALLSHIPLQHHQTRGSINVHGHVHNDPLFEPEPHQINICVEHTDYRPIHYDELRAMIEARVLQLEEQEVRMNFSTRRPL